VKRLPLLLATALLSAGCGGGTQSAPGESAPCHAQYYPDHDGDGFSGSMDAIEGDDCEVAPEGYTIGFHDDCDDTDPDVFRIVFADADGDGFIPEDGERCVGQKTPEGYTSANRGDDCDDGDPDVFERYGPDLDGDGYIANGADLVCTSNPPEDYLPTSLIGQPDCDDADPELHPNTWDSFGDGVDSDCDGNDNPPVCTPEARAVLDAEPETDSCEGADLALVGAMPCAPCHGQPGQVVIRVSSQGSQASPESELELEIDGELSSVAIPALEPGTAAPFTFVAETGVVAALAAPDCDSSNDEITVPIESTSCTR
jgi:hypothetical protein